MSAKELTDAVLDCLVTVEFKMSGTLDSSRVCLAWDTAKRLNAIQSYLIKTGVLRSRFIQYKTDEPEFNDAMEKELRELVTAMLDSCDFKGTDVRDAEGYLIGAKTAKALRALRAYMGYVQVTGTVYGASYSGCDGWSNWRIETIEFFCPASAVKRRKEEHEAAVREKSSDLNRRYIEWD